MLRSLITLPPLSLTHWLTIVEVSLQRRPRISYPLAMLSLATVVSQSKRDTTKCRLHRDQRETREDGMCCQTSAQIESLHLFTIVSDCIYRPIKVDCFPVSHLWTMYDAKLDRWKVFESRAVHVPQSFSSCDFLKFRKKGHWSQSRKKERGWKKKQKKPCHIRSHACSWNIIRFLPPTTAGLW